MILAPGAIRVVQVQEKRESVHVSMCSSDNTVIGTIL